MGKLQYFWLMFFTFCVCKSAPAQYPVLKHYPKVDVTVQLLSDVYQNADSIKLKITITNHKKNAQTLYFGGFAWGLSGVVVDKNGRSVTELPCRCEMDSQIYFEEELVKRHWGRILKPDSSLSDIYPLNRILILNFKHFNQLPVGKYELSLSYFGNDANKVSFTIE